MMIYLSNYNTGGYGAKWKTLKKLFNMSALINISYLYDKKNLINFLQDFKK